MFATTFVKISEQEFELRVANDVAEPTSKWLTNQECKFNKLSYNDCTGFRIFGIPKVVLQRLSEKFPLVAANDNVVLISPEEQLQIKVGLLRRAANEGEWSAIVQVTSAWNNALKKEVWKALNHEERILIERLKLKNSISALDKTQLRKMVTLLKEVAVIDKDFKLANRNEVELLEELFKFLVTKKAELDAALTLVKAIK